MLSGDSDRMRKTKALDFEQIEDGWWVASTPDIDRDGDIIEPLGIQLANYLKNPILLFAHIYNEAWAVIGRAVEIVVDGGALKIKPEWRQPASDSDPMHIIQSLIDAGLIKALSIGFDFLEYEPIQTGWRFIKSELLEISLVPIPAQQNALRLAAKAFEPAPSEPAESLPTPAEPTFIR